jgi:hypothetical protein
VRRSGPGMFRHGMTTFIKKNENFFGWYDLSAEIRIKFSAMVKVFWASLRNTMCSKIIIFLN